MKQTKLTGKEGKERRVQFGSRFGVIAVTVGSAVGLGNIWRFPYEAGTNGGGAFLLLNLLFVLAIGVPVICAEFVIGRRSGSNVLKAFGKLSERRWWGIVGIIGILASIMIMSFYSVVAGWTMDYLWISLNGLTTGQSEAQLHERFGEFIGSDSQPLICMVLFLLCNYFVLRRGVKKGIEKISNILMPLMVVLLVVLAVRTLMLPKAGEGLCFLFYPDFGAVTPKVILNALGQAFFSLSLGLGCMITYASYFRKDAPMMSTAVSTSLLDTGVAILAGVIIFPAVFSFGHTPAAGPQLVFEVLPSIFGSMQMGAMWSAVFFLVLFFASLTSTISMSEISIAYLQEEWGMKRGSATVMNIGIVMVFGALCTLSFGSMSDVKVWGMTVFNLFDYVSSNIFLPIGGLLIALFAGWTLPRGVVREELLCGEAGRWAPMFATVVIFCLRWLAPAAIVAVFVSGLIG